MKTIEISTGFLGEEFTIKSALNYHIKANEQLMKDLKKQYGKEFIPNQHLLIAAVKNSKSILKKLESK